MPVRDGRNPRCSAKQLTEPRDCRRPRQVFERELDGYFRAEHDFALALREQHRPPDDTVPWSERVFVTAVRRLDETAARPLRDVSRTVKVLERIRGGRDVASEMHD